MATLLEKIKTHDAKVAVIGIGYVGLPLCVEMAKAGFRTTGYDKHEVKVKQRQRRQELHRRHHRRRCSGRWCTSGKLDASTDPKVLGDADVVIICVPTPLNKTKEPDISFIIAAAEDRSSRTCTRTCSSCSSRRPTRAPPREVLLPKLQERGSRSARTSSCASRPSASTRATRSYHTTNTPKVVGGIDAALPRGDPGALRRRSSRRWCRSRRTDAAEMVQAPREHLPRGQHRPRQRGRDHVPQARASTSGRSSTPRRPSRSASCRSTRARASAATASRSIRSTCRGSCATLKYEARFIELADEINTAHARSSWSSKVAGRAQRPEEGGQRLARCSCSASPTRRTSTTCASRRRSTSSSCCSSKGAEVSYHDPYVPVAAHRRARRCKSVARSTMLDGYDCVVVVTDHSEDRLQPGRGARPGACSTPATRSRTHRPTPAPRSSRSKRCRRGARA